MKTVRNSYFKALLEATCEFKFPIYSDFWRCYHHTALMLESDSCFFDEKDSFLTTTKEEEKTVLEVDKKLYVPVTRKVSPEIRKK